MDWSLAWDAEVTPAVTLFIVSHETTAGRVLLACCH